MKAHKNKITTFCHLPAQSLSALQIPYALQLLGEQFTNSLPAGFEILGLMSSDQKFMSFVRQPIPQPPSPVLQEDQPLQLNVTVTPKLTWDKSHCLIFNTYVTVSLWVPWVVEAFSVVLVEISVFFIAENTEVNKTRSLGAPIFSKPSGTRKPTSGARANNWGPPNLHQEPGQNQQEPL